MAVLPAIKIQEYYEKYQTKEIFFNKSIRQETGLDTSKVMLKMCGAMFPCVLYSCSMSYAKIVMNLDEEAFNMIQNAKNALTLHFSFLPELQKREIQFFVSCTTRALKSFKINDENDTSYIITLAFYQKPPDDLIEILGRVLESIENFEKRKELRIKLDKKIANEMGFISQKALIEIDSINRPCIITDISASGCGAILMLLKPDLIVNKTIRITYHLQDPKMPNLELIGTVKRYEQFESKKLLYQIGILYDAQSIPYKWKNIINGYIDELEHKIKFNR
jgi:hypothetical protein